jgi:hypothetical protein
MNEQKEQTLLEQLEAVSFRADQYCTVNQVLCPDDQIVLLADVKQILARSADGFPEKRRYPKGHCFPWIEKMLDWYEKTFTGLELIACKED